MAAAEDNKMRSRYPKIRPVAKRKPDRKFDTRPTTGNFNCAMIQDLPPHSDHKGTRAFILLKAVAALGFMTGANLIILYAC